MKLLSKEKSKEKDEKTLTNIYVGFSGADFLPVLNGTPIGEVDSVTYEEDFANYPFITGTIYTYVFNNSTFRDHISDGKQDEFVLYFNDQEYGQKFTVRFEGFELLKRKGSFSVNDLSFKESYTFKADKIVFDHDTPFGELENQVGTFRYLDKVIPA